MFGACISIKKKTAVSKTRQSHPSSPSALPQAENTIEATATALNELGKGVAILGTTWECGPSAARAKNLVMSPHQRRDTKNTRERERKKSIKLFIYLFIKETKNQFIYLSVYLFVYLSVCQRNQMHLFDIEHRICMDMSQTACQPQPKRGLVTSCVSSISLVASHPNTQLDTQHLLLPNR